MPIYDYHNYRIFVSPYTASGKWKCRATWFKFTKEIPEIQGPMCESSHPFETEQEAIGDCINHAHHAIDVGEIKPTQT
jgi:hypothetical protein